MMLSWLLCVACGVAASADGIDPKLLPQGVTLPEDAEALNELHQNVRDHQAWLDDLCQRFYCGPTERVEKPVVTDTYPCGMYPRSVSNHGLQPCFTMCITPLTSPAFEPSCEQAVRRLR